MPNRWFLRVQWHAGARTWTPQSHPRERLAAQRLAASDEEDDVDRDPRARTAPGRAGRDGIPARCRRRCTLSAVGTRHSTLPFENSLSKYSLDSPLQVQIGLFIPVKLKGAPGRITAAAGGRRVFGSRITAAAGGRRVFGSRITAAAGGRRAF